MKFINIVSLVIMITMASAIPLGIISPGCAVPGSSDSTSMWCINTMILNNVNTANTASPTPFFFTTSSFCSANASYMQFAISLFGQSSPNAPPSYVSSSYNKFIQVCSFNTTGAVLNATCRYSKTLQLTSDVVLPGFWAMTNNFTYGNATQTSLQGGFFTGNDSRVLSTYCSEYNDTTIATSHFMPPSCVTIINNAAAMNICQPSFMENMPSCDQTGSLTSSVSYKPVALSGKSACVVPATSSVFTSFSTSPLSCTSPSLIVNDVTKTIEGCGTLSTGLYATGAYSATIISISPATTLYSLFDYFIF